MNVASTYSGDSKPSAPKGRWSHWSLAVLGVELRKVVAYRADFWINFLGNFSTEFVVAFFLWRAIFASGVQGSLTSADQTGVQQIGGMTFEQMMLFYLMSPLLSNIMRGPEMHFISKEIYDGSLSRYIVYPVPFLRFKYVSHFCHGLIACLQGAALVAIYLAFFDVPGGVNFTSLTFVAGAGTAMLAGVLYFSIAACLEMVAFWAENVWSLMVMLKYFILLMGGGMLPLAIYPVWAQNTLSWTPFPWLIHFPIQVALGRVTGGQWLEGTGLLVFWSAVFALAANWIWRRGSREYTGVGA